MPSDGARLGSWLAILDRRVFMLLPCFGDVFSESVEEFVPTISCSALGGSCCYVFAALLVGGCWHGGGAQVVQPSCFRIGQTVLLSGPGQARFALATALEAVSFPSHPRTIVRSCHRNDTCDRACILIGGGSSDGACTRDLCGPWYEAHALHVRAGFESKSRPLSLQLLLFLDYAGVCVTWQATSCKQFFVSCTFHGSKSSGR
jgi:hypothetical protein